MDITIKVLGELDRVRTRIVAPSDTKETYKMQLRMAISSLEAEILDLDKCPYHAGLDLNVAKHAPVQKTGERGIGEKV